MSLYRHINYKRRWRMPKWSWSLGIVVLVIAIVAGIIIYSKHTYQNALQPLSKSQRSQVVTITQGSSVKDIASQLQQAHLIRSATAFEIYVRSKKISGKLQAGSFAFSPDQDVPTIVAILTKGRVSTELVTILPGQRIDQVRASLINYGFKPADVDSALDPAQYADLPVLAYKPASANTLEGLLWPDSWYKDAVSPPSNIIRQSLEEMQQHLTPDVQAGFASENLSVYQGLTLTSIVLQEVNKPDDQTQAAQVFFSRLKAGSRLGSDASTLYGSIVATGVRSLTYDSPYNTELHAGLPPTPISTINQSSLYAVTHPANTNWLYFVTGDDGTTYFSTTLQEHQAQTQKYCHKLCAQE